MILIRHQAPGAVFVPRRRDRLYTHQGMHTAEETRTGQLVDHLAVERTVNGDFPQPLNFAEKRLAGRLLLERGIAHREIARRIGVAPRTVIRWSVAHQRQAG